ncbi:MAG: hypothetical protein EXQ55_02935 [Acidobacteria bacterium]|nr:hypothetical protein [Acidobacteriota bacterium]
MRRLKNAYRGERAAVILGGPSLVEQQFDFGRLRSKSVVTFLESKALTPRFLASGLTPDYFLMLSPDKCLSNGFHNWVFRAFLAGFRLDGFVSPEFAPIVREMRERFDEYFEPGNVKRGAHKRYRWRSGVQMKDSPCELLGRLPTTRIVSERTLLDKYCPNLAWANERYLYNQRGEPEPFSLEHYYGVIEEDSRVIVRNCSFHNSAAIALYPLLRYMGFRTVYFLGMDMSMLGSMEYGAPYTFKSMLHYRWYFWRTRHVFNASYRPNRPWYIRPQSEFEALKSVIDPEKIDLVRVFAPYRYTVPIEFMHTISEADFWLQ